MQMLQCFNLKNSYMFQASLAHNQGVQLYKRFVSLAIVLYNCKPWLCAIVACNM